MGVVLEEQPADRPQGRDPASGGSGQKGGRSGLESKSSFHPILRLDFGP